MSPFRETKQKSFTFFLSVVLILNENTVLPKIILNKCCGINESFNDYGMCRKKPETIDGVDKWWWVPKEYNVEMDYLSMLDDKSVAYGWLHENPCPHDRELLKYYHVGDNWDIHFDLSIFDQEIVLNISMESAYHDPDNEAQHEMSSNLYCVDWYSNGAYFAVACPCDIMTCVRKCCKDNQNYNVSHRNLTRFDQRDCVDVEGDEGFWTPALSESMGTAPLKYYRRINATPHCERYSKILVDKSSKLILEKDGSIKVNGTEDKNFPVGEYCGERTLDGDELLLFCMAAENKSSTFYGILFIIGSVSLFLAIVLAVLLPDMRRNIHGRMSLAHNIMLFIGYIVLGVVTLHGKSNEMTMSNCKAASFIIQFSLLSSFFWLNVMCIDIAWTFSGLKPIQGSARQRDLKKFIYYSLYAWGSTSIIVTATAIVEYDANAKAFKPNFGLAGKSCFFNNRAAMLLFFYGPMATLLIANLILFMYTVTKIVAIKRETAILNSKDSASNQKNKQRLMLYGKLFCLMGVTWLFEVISWALQSQNAFFMFTDILNLLRGVFVFMIFCCKRQVYYQTRNKLLRLCGKEALESGYSTRDTRSYQTNSSTVSKSHVPATPVAPRVVYNRQASTLSIELNKC